MNIKAELEGKKINEYHIQESLGEGWSGYVYRATKNGTSFAIKIIKPEHVNSKSKFIKQENRIRLQLLLKEKYHPNLIRIIEGGTFKVKGLIEKGLFIVMEYLSPEVFQPLSKIKLQTEIRKDKVHSLLTQIANAAEFLHNNNIVHRDIKPSNILINTNQTRAILLDLGVIKIEGENTDFDFDVYNTDDSEEFLGTLAYTPIEIIKHNNLEYLKNIKYKYEATSFYQLGLILYELLAEQTLFAHRQKDGIIGLIEEGILSGIDLSKLTTEVRLQELLKHCLSNSWQERVSNINWLSFNFETLIPTIVILYAGGTIGSVSSNSNTRGLRQIDEDPDFFYSSLKKRIERDFHQIHNTKSGIPFYIIPTSLPPEDIILSENATPDTWNSLLKKIEHIVTNHGQEYNSINGYQEKNNKYLSGIIILHGTDTLAYTASALTLGMKGLPCPVIITGSNQPPGEDRFNEKEILLSSSDAWKNLRLSINFIQSIGHRYTEVFVAFNSTIFHGLNLKKVPLYNAYEFYNSTEIVKNEPYTYQNCYLPNKYAFKYIDGIFCNNLYPFHSESSDANIHFDSLIKDAYHIRNKIYDNQDEKFEVTTYDNLTELLVNAPVPCSGVSMIDDKEALVLVGYDSGTFSSDPRHPISLQIKKWLDKDKLVFLISDFGLYPSDISYDVHENFDDNNNWITLYGIIKETAIPFVSKLVSQLRKNLGQLDKIPLQKKIVEIKKILNRDSHFLKSLPGFIIGNPLDLRANIQRLDTSLKEKKIDDPGSKAETLYNNERVTKTIDSIRKKQDNIPAVKFSELVLLEHEMFDWIILNTYNKLHQMGVGPNGFKELYDMGFSFGKELFHIVNYNDTDKTHLRNTDILTHLSDHDTKDAIIEKVKNIFKNCNMILNKNGISNCIESSVEVFNLSDDNSLKIRYNVYAKPNSFQSIRQKYSIKFFDENEEDFFNTIRDGNIDGNIKESFTQRIIEKLNKLNIDSWSQQLYPYDWFILGIHKGILYKGLLELKFDDWVKRFIKHPEPRYEQYLKESIVTNIKASSESVLQFEMTYESRDVYTDDSKT